MKMLIRKRLCALLLLVLFIASCSLRTTRPGAVDALDSRAFDVLGVAHITIEAMKTDCPSGPTSPCPQSKKDAINKVIDAYNIAAPAWVAYRNVVKAGGIGISDRNALTDGLSEIIDALSGLKKAEGN